MGIGFEMANYREDMVKSLREVIRIKSVRQEALEGKPFGEGPYRALEYMLALAEELGFKTKNVDGYAGHAEYGDGDEIIGVLVHLDVVPEGEGWSHDPFGGIIADNKVYGRGASDNKGPAVAALYGLKLLKDKGLVPDKRIRVIFGTGEETGMDDMKYYFSKEPLPQMGFSPDAAYPIINREKGILNIYFSSEGKNYGPLWIGAGEALNIVPAKCEAKIPLEVLDNGEGDKIERLRDRLNIEMGEDAYDIVREQGAIKVFSFGKSAHGASPAGGINAISRMLMFFARLNEEKYLKGLLKFLHFAINDEWDGESLGIKMEDEPSGSLTLNLATIEYCRGEQRAGIDIRYPVTADKGDIVSKITSKAEEYSVKVKVTGHTEPLYVPDDHPLIGSLMRAYETITGEPARLLSMGGGTYARTLKNNGVAFGGVGEGGHQPDEHVDIDQLVRHAMICAQGIYELAFNT